MRKMMEIFCTFANAYSLCSTKKVQKSSPWGINCILIIVPTTHAFKIQYGGYTQKHHKLVLCLVIISRLCKFPYYLVGKWKGQWPRFVKFGHACRINGQTLLNFALVIVNGKILDFYLTFEVLAQCLILNFLVPSPNSFWCTYNEIIFKF